MNINLTDMFDMFFPQDSVGRFYVYVLFRPDGRPFYVGKGCGNRIKDHEREARRGHECHKCRVIRKIWREGGEVDRQIVFGTDNELKAMQFEARLIYRFRPHLTNVLECDANMWQPARPKRAYKTKQQRRRERIADAVYGMNALDRKLRRAVLTRNYAAQEQIEEEIAAYRSWIYPPIQLQLDEF